MGAGRRIVVVVEVSHTRTPKRKIMLQIVHVSGLLEEERAGLGDISIPSCTDKF
jgi:hypothetical protein